ncbi:hypothetical protein [Hypericibacter sp.]|uniref:hypothetical protein n=1 Tax=Hypericibacter sp. TaxID=2705401 RepID=UPI003D6DA866
MGETPRRRGRPRKHPPQIDPGTPELQRHRILLAGAADAPLAEDPLALMVARGLLQPTQAQAGRYYASLYRRAVGPPHLSTNAHYQRLAMNAPATAFGEEDAGVAEARRLYRLGKEKLLQAGRLVAEATEDLVVFGVRPGILMAVSVTGRNASKRSKPAVPADARYRAILAGLEALAAGYGFRDSHRSR